MFKWLESRILWGSLLILGGLLFLLENLNIISLSGYFWVILLGLGAVFFLSIFLSNRLNWWALIPGLTLLSVAVVVLLAYLSPGLESILGGFIILGGIGLSFLIIYLLNRSFWWAIIPAGVMFSVALAVFLDENTSGFEPGGILLLGLGATFAAVALVPTSEGRMKWPWIPAGILAVIGLIVTAASGKMWAYFWPAALIIGGIVLIYFTLRPRK